jgi:hypothetical protein
MPIKPIDFSICLLRPELAFLRFRQKYWKHLSKKETPRDAIETVKTVVVFFDNKKNYIEKKQHFLDPKKCSNTRNPCSKCTCAGRCCQGPFCDKKSPATQKKLMKPVDFHTFWNNKKKHKKVHSGTQENIENWKKKVFFSNITCCILILPRQLCR